MTGEAGDVVDLAISDLGGAKAADQHVPVDGSEYPGDDRVEFGTVVEPGDVALEAGVVGQARVAEHVGA